MVHRCRLMVSLEGAYLKRLPGNPGFVFVRKRFKCAPHPRRFPLLGEDVGGEDRCCAIGLGRPVGGRGRDLIRRNEFCPDIGWTEQGPLRIGEQLTVNPRNRPRFTAIRRRGFRVNLPPEHPAHVASCVRSTRPV